MKVHSLLDSLGLSYIWSNQIHTIEIFKRIVKQRLMDQFMQEWQSRVAENSVSSNYRLFKKKKKKMLWEISNLSPIYPKAKSIEI